MSDSLWPHGLQPTRLLCPCNSPGKNTGVDCQSLLQGIFPTQGLKPGLLHCRKILYCLSYHGSRREVRPRNVVVRQECDWWMPSRGWLDCKPFQLYPNITCFQTRATNVWVIIPIGIKTFKIFKNRIEKKNKSESHIVKLSTLSNMYLCTRLQCEVFYQKR